jgi:hypothetical protein
MKFIKNITYISILWLIALLTSCDKYESDYFDETTDERIAEKAIELGKVLQSAKHGWHLTYFIQKEDIGGYNVYLKFKDDNACETAAELDFIAEPQEEIEEANYSITHVNDIMISFNTYTYFTQAGDPSMSMGSKYGRKIYHENGSKVDEKGKYDFISFGIGMPRGPGGENSFTVKSFNKDEIVLEGYSNKLIMKMVPLKEDFDWIADLKEKRKAAETLLLNLPKAIDFRTYSVEFDENNKFEYEPQSRFRVCKVAFGADDDFVKVTNRMTATNNGAVFETPVEGNGISFFGVRFDGKEMFGLGKKSDGTTVEAPILETRESVVIEPEILENLTEYFFRGAERNENMQSNKHFVMICSDNFEATYTDGYNQDFNQGSMSEERSAYSYMQYRRDPIWGESIVHFIYTEGATEDWPLAVNVKVKSSYKGNGIYKFESLGIHEEWHTKYSDNASEEVLNNFDSLAGTNSLSKFLFSEDGVKIQKVRNGIKFSRPDDNTTWIGFYPY